MQQSVSSSTINYPQLGPVRSFLWPVHKHEYKKLLPMLLIFFLITFIYNLLRGIKTSIVVKTAGSGASVIPFLKVGFVLPGAFFLTYLFTKCSSRLSRENTLYVMMGGFLIFFLIFAFLIYPNSQYLELAFLKNLFPNISEGYLGLISSLRYWHLSIFYVISELWGTIVLSVLFWGFANEVTSINEAKRFYPLFGLSANCAGIFSGQTGQLLTVFTYQPKLAFGNNAWEQTIMLHILFVFLIGVLIIAVFRLVNKQDIFKSKDKKYAYKERSKKELISLRESLTYLSKSKYAFYIMVIVASYYLVNNLAEVMWAYQVNKNFVDFTSYSSYMHKITFLTSILAILFSLFLSGNIISRYGWLAAALITPIIWGLTSLGFFSTIMLSDLVANFIASPAALILIFGSAQICLGRASKYTVFNETKEIVFIPLAKKEQRKIKAAVDGIVSRFGKAGGSLIYILLFIFCDSLSDTVPYVAIIILLMVGFWSYSIISLNKLVNKDIDKDESVLPDINIQKKTFIEPEKMTT